MKYNSVFDIIGPVMVGPSSSHTAGAVRIGQIARNIFGEEPAAVAVHFFGSFAGTYRGHATDVAIIAGILGFDTDDPRVKNAVHIARDRNISISFYKEDEVPEHPNTVKLILKKGTEQLEVTGVSIGGGVVHITGIDGFRLNLSGDHPALITLHQDMFGMVAAVTGILAEYEVNIGHMEVSRQEKGKTALMVIETDEAPADAMTAEIRKQDGIEKVIILQ